MILISTGEQDSRNLDAATIFAMQLAERGHNIALDVTLFPEDVSRGQKYDAAPFLKDVEDAQLELVILLNAENLSTALLSALRSYPAPVAAIARFSSQQSKIGAQAKIAYASGQEPLMVDLADLYPEPLLEKTIAPVCGSLIHENSQAKRRPRVLVYVPPERLNDPMAITSIDALRQKDICDLSLITTSAGKKKMLNVSRRDPAVTYGYAEVPPLTLARRSDILIFLGKRLEGERMAVLATEAMYGGKTVVDGTDDCTLLKAGAPVLQGPSKLSALVPFLDQTGILDEADMSASRSRILWSEQNSIDILERALDISSTGRAPTVAEPKNVFFPTNGNGLGHAQRCLLIADAMQETPRFAAFPSCTTLIRSRGYDCLPLVQRSDDHREPYANDLINHLRFDAALDTNDHLIFDGGYVFESVMRAILSKDLKATWIRRGLWQEGQVNAKALERGKVFSQTIVPQEAFPELNTRYSFDATTYDVGPIVQRQIISAQDRDDLRDRLKARFDRDFDRLVITMLGGGVASDRSAQLQTIAAKLDQRNDCLNLILVWPNSIVLPALYGWRNSRVVTSQNAVRLSQAADLTISAVGYNSFHEILYHKVPSIFLPQIAPFMDDQDRRARSASDRGLATTVLPEDLMQLGREIEAYLDGTKPEAIRKAFDDFQFPGVGNEDAAKLIERLH